MKKFEDFLNESTKSVYWVQSKDKNSNGWDDHVILDGKSKTEAKTNFYKFLDKDANKDKFDYRLIVKSEEVIDV